MAFTGSGSGSEKANSSSEQMSMQPGQQSLVPVGQGLAALPRKLVDRVRANEYINFLELPPAKRKTRTASQMMDGQILLVQAADLNQRWKIIPDLATWLQCYALYVAMLAPDQPRSVPELMAYQTIIFQGEPEIQVAVMGRVRPELSPRDGWSSREAVVASRPARLSVARIGAQTGAHRASMSSKRPWSVTFGTQSQQQLPKLEVCRKFNRFAGDCKFGKDYKLSGMRVAHVESLTRSVAARPMKQGCTEETVAIETEWK